MFISAFKTNRIYLPILMVIVTFILWLDGFLFFSEISVHGDYYAPFYDMLVPLLEKNKFINVLLAFLFLTLQAFILNNVVTQNNLVERYSYMPGFIYAVLMSSSFDLLSLNPVLIANFFLILAFNKILDIFKEDKIYLELFNAGFLISIASLFYYPAIFVIFLAFISLFIYFITNIRRIVAIALGFFTPFFFLGVYYFMIDLLSLKFNEFISLYNPFLIFHFETDKFFLYYLFVFGFIALIALFKVVFVVMREIPVRIRKRYQIVIVFLILMLISLLYISDLILIHHAFVNIPIAVILSVFFHSNKRKFLNEFLFTLLIVAMIIFKFESLI